MEYLPDQHFVFSSASAKCPDNYCHTCPTPGIVVVVIVCGQLPFHKQMIVAT